MSDRFELIATPLAGLQLLQRKPLGDERGYLERMFCTNELASFGWQQPISQINRTLTVKKGTFRGLHMQRPPYAEMKLITCLKGEVWDVAVDVRKDSPTFLQWHAVILSAENKCSYLLPEGFAHGFQTLTDEVEMMYCHSQRYMPAHELGLNILDEKLGINLPLAISEISGKDRAFPMLDNEFSGVSA